MASDGGRNASRKARKMFGRTVLPVKGWNRRVGIAPAIRRFRAPRSLPELVVGGFLRDRDVVRMALAQAGGADLHELGEGAHLLDVAGAAITHAGAQAAHHLEHRLR